MHYTIATLTDHNSEYGHLELEIGKSGNEYFVGIYRDVTKEYTHNKFDSMEEAFSIFSQLSEWIVKSYYTEYQKRNYLLTGII